MTSGYWPNQDGLFIQYGTQKAIPEVGGEYLVYGENREVEILVPLVGLTLGTGNPQVPAPPTSFSGTTTAIAAGVQSLTEFVPLQTTAVNTGGTSITLTKPQIFIEQVELVPLITATGGTSISMGLALLSSAANAGTSPPTFVQASPNAGVQILNAVLTATMATTVGKTVWTAPGSTGFNSSGTTVAGGGTWVGTNMPLVTNSLTPLPQAAYISTIASGSFTNGLIKVRIKYCLYGSINQ